MPPTRSGHMRTSSVQAGRSRPTQQKPDNQQGYGRTTVARYDSLTNKKRRYQKQALIAAAHREGGGSDPTQYSRVRPSCSDRGRGGGHECDLASPQIRLAQSRMVMSAAGTETA